MVITQQFLEAEVKSLETEMQKAQLFFTQAQATISAYKMLVAKINEPEPEKQDAPNPTDNP